MRTLIVFYSHTGTTKLVAEKLAKKLGADVEEILALDLKTGFWGFFKAGHQAAAKKKVKIEEGKLDPAGYDLVLLGTPVWVGTVASPVRTYIEQNKDVFKKVAFCCTCGGEQNKTFTEMEKICCKKPIATLELKAKNVKSENYQESVERFVQKMV